MFGGDQMKKYKIKKRRFILNIIVLVIIAVIFSKGFETYTQAKNTSINKKIYNYLSEEGNQREVYGTAIELNQGSSENTCVYFISEVLRRNDFIVSKDTSNTSQLLSVLGAKGWKKQTNYKNLSAGDICFTTNVNGNEDSFPSHTYVFMKWVKEGNYDYAYICDNQAKDYKDQVYHIRNIRVMAKANGFDKDAFAFFMKKA